MPVSAPDVEAALGRGLDDVEAARVPQLVLEAVGLVEGYLGRDLPDPVPGRIRAVLARMVARVLLAPDEALVSESVQQTAGPFAHTARYAAGASGGAPWLTTVDRTALRRWRRGGRVISVEMR